MFKLYLVHQIFLEICGNFRNLKTLLQTYSYTSVNKLILCHKLWCLNFLKILVKGISTFQVNFEGYNGILNINLLTWIPQNMGIALANSLFSTIKQRLVGENAINIFGNGKCFLDFCLRNIVRVKIIFESDKRRFFHIIDRVCCK